MTTTTVLTVPEVCTALAAVRLRIAAAASGPLAHVETILDSAMTVAVTRQTGVVVTLDSEQTAALLSLLDLMIATFGDSPVFPNSFQNVREALTPA